MEKVTEASNALLTLLIELELSPEQILNVHRKAIDFAEAFTMYAVKKAIGKED